MNCFDVVDSSAAKAAALLSDGQRLVAAPAKADAPAAFIQCRRLCQTSSGVMSEGWIRAMRSFAIKSLN